MQSPQSLTARTLGGFGLLLAYISLTPLVFILAGGHGWPDWVWIGAAYLGLAGSALMFAAGIVALVQIRRTA